PCRGGRRPHRSSHRAFRRRRFRRPKSARGQCSGDSRSARKSRSRNGAPKYSGLSLFPGSDRCGRSGIPRQPSEVAGSKPWRNRDRGRKVFRFRHQPDFPKPLNDVAEEVGRGGKVKKIVAVGVVILVDFGKRFFELVIGSGIVEISTHVTYAADEPLP